MPKVDDIRWFKQQFSSTIEASTGATPFDLDMLVAIACQETGHVWSTLRRKALPVPDILSLCVGDTLDEDKGRRAFPKTKAELTAVSNGQEMFDIAHKALVDMAVHIAGFKQVATRPDKFCHGFGVFQRDLQFFKQDPDYFLSKNYEKFEKTLAHCLQELDRGLRKIGFGAKESLSDFEFACVAIAYNTGGFKPAKGLRQGHFNGERFYGEEVFSFVQLSRTVPASDGAPLILPPASGEAILPPPTPLADQQADMIVDTREGMLRLRSEPELSEPRTKNVIAHLPDGHPVRSLTGKKVNGFFEVETSLFGALLRGFASANRLVPTRAPTPISIVTPSRTPPADGIVAVTMPHRPGHITTRAAVAGAHSLNEPGQPERAGDTPTELVASISAIIEWLAVEKPEHQRYKPRDGLTFCNIYAHDFCHLAGIFLPRVWWSQRALDDLAAGTAVAPLIGNTISELRANDLFRWLRDFGPDFGWRQTGTLDKLQQASNEGAIGLIVARRREDGRSGHIVVCVAETGSDQARRNAAGEVVAPLQSQAGATNFRRKQGTLNWWRDAQFAESAFWVHA